MNGISTLAARKKAIHLTSLPGDIFRVLGINSSGKKVAFQFSKWEHAREINLAAGTLHLIRGDKAHLISRV